MQRERDERPGGGGGGKGKAPAPPPPPPRHGTNDGGHRLGPRRPRRPPARREVLAVAAVGFMAAAAVYLLLADALGAVPAAGDPSSGAWSFLAYVLWIAGVNLYYVCWSS